MKVKFGKMQGTGFACDDRECDVLCNGEVIGAMTAVIGNVGSMFFPEWKVTSYDAVFYETDKEMTEEVRSGKTDIQSTYEARRKIRAWFENQI